MKIKVQAQHLQPGDRVGSGEIVNRIILASISFPTNKVMLVLSKAERSRTSYWGKYTMINVEREKKVKS